MAGLLLRKASIRFEKPQVKASPKASKLRVQVAAAKAAGLKDHARAGRKLELKLLREAQDKALSARVFDRVVLEVGKGSKAVDKDVADYARRKRREASKVARAYYVGMFKEVGRVLDAPPFASPAAPASSGVFRPVKVPSGVAGAKQAVDILLAPGRVNESLTWKALDKGYRTGYDEEGNPTKWLPIRVKYGKSKTYWKRTGKLSGYYKAWLAGQHQITLIKSYEGSLIVKHGKRRGSLSTVSFGISYPEVQGAALQGILRKPYILKKGSVYANINREYLFNPGGPYNVSRVAYPEYVRPMLSAFSARMGKAYAAALSGLLRPR